MDAPRLAVLGTAHVHLPDHLQTALEEGFHIDGFFDLDRDRARSVASRWGGKVYSARESVRDHPPDAVLVCSETTQHEADVGFALEQGWPILVEKPLAHDPKVAERLAEMAEERKILLDTAFFLRTIPAVQHMREAVVSGRIGRPLEARARFAHDGALADWLDLSGWMTNPTACRFGGFGDEAIHALDLLMWMLGPVEAGVGMKGHGLGLQVDSHGAGLLAHEHGGISVVSGGWVDGRLRFELEIMGELGCICIRDETASLWVRGVEEPVRSETLPPLNAGEGFRPFARAVRARDAIGLVPPRESAAVQRVLDTLYATPLRDER